MDAAGALADLIEISSQIEAAVVAAADGAVLASTLADGDSSAQVARAALRLLDEAGAAGPAGAAVSRLHAATPQGSVFVVREGGRVAAATAGSDATVGLVLYDLRACLRAIEERPKPKPRRRPRQKAAAEPKPKPKPKAKAKPKPRPRRKPADEEGTDGRA